VVAAVTRTMARRAIDMSRHVDKYVGTGLFLALTRDRSEVLATAPSIVELVSRVRQLGVDRYVTVKAPSTLRGTGRIY
jgi:hypothetical protein